MELIEYWRVIRRRILLVLALPVIAAIVSGFFATRIPPTYEGTATLLFNVPTTANMPDSATISGVVTSGLFDSAVVKSHPKLDMTASDVSDTLSASVDGELLNIHAFALTQEKAAIIANDSAMTFVQQGSRLLNMPHSTLVNQASNNPNIPPVSPHKRRSVGLAFGAALLIGLGLAFILEYLDMRVRTEADMARYLQIPVLGSVQTYRTKEERRRTNDARIPS